KSVTRFREKDVFEEISSDSDMRSMVKLLPPKRFIYVYVDEGEIVKKNPESVHDSNLCGDSSDVQDANLCGHSTDDDYEPSGDSSSDDGLSDGDLVTDDEEYISARKDREIFRKSQDEDGRNTTDFGHEDEAVEGSNKEFVDKKDLQFVLGMKFDSIVQCKDAIQTHAIYNGCNIQFWRSNEKQVEARCQKPCPWKLYASFIKEEGRVAIKTLVAEHTCYRDIKTRQATSSWVAKEFLDKFRKKPRMKVADLEDQIMEKYAVQPNKWKLYRGKYKALEMLRGSEEEHYGCLRNYIAELQRVDRNGRFELLLDTGSVFKAFFIGFSALRQGFLQGCRPVIGFDGCFLKTFLGGVLLCAIGKDGNNQVFPIAWAVANLENEENWKWFLEILFQDLGIGDGLGWTFISDQQK
ncbi:Unknown protein, partial [Striga hermonthica]